MRYLIQKILSLPIDESNNIFKNSQKILEEVKYEKKEYNKLKPVPISQNDPTLRKLIQIIRLPHRKNH